MRKKWGGNKEQIQEIEKKVTNMVDIKVTNSINTLHMNSLEFRF